MVQADVNLTATLKFDEQKIKKIIIEKVTKIK